MTLGHARKMWALDCPTLTVDAATLMYGLSGMMTIPMPSFLIEHDRGLVLFDTGIAPESITDPAGVYGQELADGLGIGGTPDQAVDKQIEALGYKTSDVTHVIASHFHFDHSGGTHLFPDAKHYAGAGELAFARFATPIAAFCYMPWQIERTAGFDWRELPGTDVDLFGDGSLVMLSLPGHTPGELGLKVRLANRTFLLTGDAVHLQQALDLEYHFPIDWDTRVALDSLRRIKRIAEAEEATIWITHDPGHWADHKPAPYCYD
ncbi:N-acyl homoserine lactonase family protein [Nocardioides marinquilinus]|uniref:N-acyl homoserine lactonase family protein n=1 Tax=Nocardioides marinquilinus TaxID=1210400 RepID=A0ABP9PCG3_9ACTN